MHPWQRARGPQRGPQDTLGAPMGPPKQRKTKTQSPMTTHAEDKKRITKTQGSPRADSPDSAELKRAPKTCKDPAGNLRFQRGFGPKAGPNQAQNIRHGTHRPAHNNSERFWPHFGVFRQRSRIFYLRDSPAQPGLGPSAKQHLPVGLAMSITVVSFFACQCCVAVRLDFRASSRPAVRICEDLVPTEASEPQFPAPRSSN